MTNREKLRDLLIDVFLLEDDEFDFSLTQEQIETWDSLGTVSMAVGLEEAFGHHMTPEQAVEVESIQGIIDYLTSCGVSFAD
jgi:acyl carrier protein